MNRRVKYRKLPPYLRRKFLHNLTRDLREYIASELGTGILVSGEVIASIAILQGAAWELERRKAAK